MTSDLFHCGYVYDDEIDFYYLRSRYYNANRGRFINADNIFDGKNLFTYCASDPVNRFDENGQAWWHWLIGAAVVVACAAAVVVTAGGAAAGIVTVATVASGSVAGSVSATVAASAFIGSSAAFGIAATNAALSSSSIEDFSEKGNWGTVAETVGGGLIGAGVGYAQSKQFYDTHYYGTTSPKELKDPPKNAYYTQWNSEGKGIRSYTRFDASGHQSWRIDYVGKAHNGISTPHVHVMERSLYGQSHYKLTKSLKDFNWRIME